MSCFLSIRVHIPHIWAYVWLILQSMYNTFSLFWMFFFFIQKCLKTLIIKNQILYVHTSNMFNSNICLAYYEFVPENKVRLLRCFQQKYYFLIQFSQQIQIQDPFDCDYESFKRNVKHQLILIIRILWDNCHCCLFYMWLNIFILSPILNLLFQWGTSSDAVQIYSHVIIEICPLHYDSTINVSKRQIMIWQQNGDCKISIDRTWW